MHSPFTINSSGTKIVVEAHGAGKPLVFAHGLTGTRHTTQSQLGALYDRYTVVSYDQRGHGDSMPLVEAAAYDVVEMAEDMAHVMDALEIERAIVGGESMGAATAVEFTLRYPERVSHLLLTAPAFGATPSSERARFHQLADAIRTLGLQQFVAMARQTWTEDFGWSNEVADTMAASFLAHKAESIAAAIDMVMEWVPLQAMDALRAITCPVCIIYWDDDPLHPAALAQEMTAILPNARLIEIPTLPAIFVEAARVGQIFDEFLCEVG